MKCAQPECPETAGNDMWSKIRAHDAGWFFTRDDKSGWCPTHTPEWVATWRDKQAAKRPGS
jgi:hypothetical protein